ncbi:MAG: autoinducer binding domain-containing protein [Alphaproteobacteria bacterium]|jgi:DNA-binding CsgD family transcriptional regulator|nr:autoinducer binding domain-containing protein [Phenylobacterium sp.]
MFDGLPDALDDCRSLQEVQALFSTSIAPLGFTVSACGAFFPTSKGPAAQFFFQTWPQDWIKLYQERNFVAVDFGVAEARRRIAPFTWADALAERSLSRAEQDLWDTVREWGWHDGFSVPIHGPAGYFGLVTMGGRPGHLSTSVRNALHMLAFQTHERCRALSGLQAVADARVALTARELECLRWVAAGKSDGEIAALLELSANTVKGHVDSGRRKLAVVTRPQAVARLVLAGLL